MLNADGGVAERQKSTYAQGFLLYAFSEYARATGKGVEYADMLFEYIERECKFDAGYYEYAKGSPELDSDFGKMLTMNNHLHIIEPIANYCRVRRSPQVEAAMRNLLHIFFERIINANCPHFDLFFTENWEPVTQINSYGHDIEGSWLLYEAAEVLGDAELLNRAKTVTLAMAEAVLTEGLNPDSGAVYDGGSRDGRITEPKRVWWAQAEGVVGFVNAYRLSGERRYRDAAFRCWDYVESRIINPDGEWFATGTDSESDENTPYLVNAWKCPYHNSRAALEICERTGK
jgi:mannobiose 2-epimerase